MSKVYVVTSGIGADYRIDAVCAARETAERAATECDETPGNVYCAGDRARVEEHELREEVTMDKPTLPPLTPPYDLAVVTSTAPPASPEVLAQVREIAERNQAALDRITAIE